MISFPIPAQWKFASKHKLPCLALQRRETLGWIQCHGTERCTHSIWVVFALVFWSVFIQSGGKGWVVTERNDNWHLCHLSNGGQSQAAHKGVLVMSRERKPKWILNFILGRSPQATLPPYIPRCLAVMSESQQKAEESADTSRKGDCSSPG